MSGLALCLGYFDSVHIGHRALIGKCAKYASDNDLKCTVHTFRQDKVGMFDSLYSFEQRQILLRNAGATLIMSDIFDKKIMETSSKDFLDNLMDEFDIRAFFCGYDYTFGKNASGNSQFLLDYATHNNVYCYVMPPVMSDGVKVSTTLIKELLLGGELVRANELLGEPFFMTGKVVKGRGVGRAFGYPTANLDYTGFLPKAGVYKTAVEVDGKEYIAVTNIGTKPTFNIDSVTVESMLIGFDGDLYGKNVTVKFKKYLRPIYKFASGEELNKQIQSDILEALC